MLCLAPGQKTSITRRNLAWSAGLHQALTREPPEPSLVSGPTWTTFQSKLDDFRAAAAHLAETAAAGDPAESRQQFVTTGGTCKACHDEYKSKDYLY